MSFFLNIFSFINNITLFYAHEYGAVTTSQWRSKEASGGTRPGAQVLGTRQHTFCSHLKTRFNQKLKQMLKKAYA